MREYKQNFARLDYPSSSCDTSYPALQQKSALYPLLFFFFFFGSTNDFALDACLVPLCPSLSSLCLQSDAGWLTPSPPGVAAFSASGVKFIKRSVELFNMKVPQSGLCGSLMWHLIPSAAALLIFTALP